MGVCCSSVGVLSFFFLSYILVVLAQALDTFSDVAGRYASLLAQRARESAEHGVYSASFMPRKCRY